MLASSAFASEVSHNQPKTTSYRVTIGATIEGAPVLNGKTEGTFNPEDFDFSGLKVEIYESETLTHFVKRGTSTGKVGEPAIKDFRYFVDNDIDYKIIVDEKTIPEGYKLSDKNEYSFKLNGKDQALNLDFIKVPAKTNTPDTSVSADTQTNSNKDSNKVQDNLAPNYTTNIYVQTSEPKDAPSNTSQANKEAAKDCDNKKLESKPATSKVKSDEASVLERSNPEPHSGQNSKEVSQVQSAASALPKTSDVTKAYLYTLGAMGLVCLALAISFRRVRAF